MIKFRYDVPLEQTMAFEAVYHEALQLGLPEKREIFDLTGAIATWMFVDGKLAGESYGIPLANSDEQIEGLSDLTDIEKMSGVYCYSNTILPAFQKQGLGTILKAHWLGLVAAKGFEIVYGHARPEGSQKLNIKFGAVLLNNFSNWYGTGEDYMLYRLVLK